MVAGALFIHIFAAVCYLVHKFLITDAASKLAHVEKQLGTCQRISEELSERLKESSL
jgi:hypothetical protein